MFTEIYIINTRSSSKESRFVRRGCPPDGTEEIWFYGQIVPVRKTRRPSGRVSSKVTTHAVGGRLSVTWVVVVVMIVYARALVVSTDISETIRDRPKKVRLGVV